LNNYFSDPTYFLSGFSNGNVVLSTFDKNEFTSMIEEENENDNNEIANRCFKDVFSYKNHKSEITALEFYPNETIFGFVVCSKYNIATFIVGNVEEKTPKFSERYKINSHMKAITSCSFHPLKEYAAFGSLDNYWSFHNILKVNY
jgi:WD40 repeat protein